MHSPGQRQIGSRYLLGASAVSRLTLPLPPLPEHPTLPYYPLEHVFGIAYHPVPMATNPPSGDGHRRGQVRDRSQVFNPQNEKWVKRDTDTGKFIDQKQDGEPFKGVRKEK